MTSPEILDKADKDCSLCEGDCRHCLENLHRKGVIALNAKYFRWPGKRAVSIERLLAGG